MTNFKSSELKDDVKDHVLTKYINSTDWNPEKINFSSKAAGPLALWTTSQIKFADIEKKVEPLKNEVA